MLFMFIPLLELTVRLPMPPIGGGGILNEVLPAGFGGGMLKDE
jgi:hypothetical protein